MIKLSLKYFLCIYYNMYNNSEIWYFMLIIIILFLLITYLVTICVKEKFYNPTQKVEFHTKSPIH